MMRPYPDFKDESKCSPQKHFKKSFSSYGIADVEESKIHFSDYPVCGSELKTEANTSDSDHSNPTPPINQNDFLVIDSPNPGNKSQPKYKNKPKELFQKAVKVVNDIKGWNEDYYQRVTWENEKSDEQWAREGESLKQKPKKELLIELKMKQYCQFAGLYNFKEGIVQHQGDVIENFNCKYKDRISHSFFKKQQSKSEELFEWILLALITLAIIPEDPKYLELFPLKKSTVFMNTWLLESPMSPKNKNLCREAKTRNHLREVMTEIYNNLMSQAWKFMDRERLELLREISESLRLH